MSMSASTMYGLDIRIWSEWALSEHCLLIFRCSSFSCVLSLIPLSVVHRKSDWLDTFGIALISSNFPLFRWLACALVWSFWFPLFTHSFHGSFFQGGLTSYCWQELDWWPNCWHWWHHWGFQLYWTTCLTNSSYSLVKNTSFGRPSLMFISTKSQAYINLSLFLVALSTLRTFPSRPAIFLMHFSPEYSIGRAGKWTHIGMVDRFLFQGTS